MKIRIWFVNEKEFMEYREVQYKTFEQITDDLISQISEDFDLNGNVSVMYSDAEKRKYIEIETEIESSEIIEAIISSDIDGRDYEHICVWEEI
jgi:hypothetical protein